MKIVFWTGGVDTHTVLVFNYLGINNDVIIAYCERSFRGLDFVDVSNCRLIDVSSRHAMLDLIHETSEYIHVNNAFKVMPQYKILKLALKELVKRKYEIISLFQEQYPYKGPNGLLRRIKWGYVYRFGLGRTHRFIGYCGDCAYKSLRKAFVPKRKLIEFIYTPWFNKHYPIQLTAKPTFVMVGQLVPRKAVIETIATFKKFDFDFFFKIIGTGPLKNEIMELISLDSRFKYLGCLTPESVQQEYLSSDFLILSSYFDGWGCSVNEAISQGCQVIVSDECGAASLVRINPNLGYIFKSGDWNYLKKCIESIKLNGSNNYILRQEIIKWARKISPFREAEYLSDILNYFFKSSMKPEAPWKF